MASTCCEFLVGLLYNNSKEWSLSLSGLWKSFMAQWHNKLAMFSSKPSHSTPATLVKYIHMPVIIKQQMLWIWEGHCRHYRMLNPGFDLLICGLWDGQPTGGLSVL